MPLKTKRWCDKRSKSDGYRLLICRYRPRAVRKEDETWDAWCSDLGPSRELHADFYRKNGPPITLAEYTLRYLEEMKNQTELIEELAQLASEGKTITLLCSSACTDATHCHRTLLKALIEQRISSEVSTIVMSATGVAALPGEAAKTSELPDPAESSRIPTD